jgi:putative membrane protein
MKLRQTISTLTPALLVLTFAATPALAQQEETVARSATQIRTDDANRAALTDGQILQILRDKNDAEIKQAKEAKDEGMSDAVKGVADMLINDHEASNKQIDELLDGELNLQDSPLGETLSKQAEETHELLQDLAGVQYDCAYLEQQVAQHEAAIDTSKNHLVPNAKDAGVKQFLTALGPKLERHLQMAKDALGKMEGCDG